MKFIIALVLNMAIIFNGFSQKTDLKNKVNALINKMTLEEKVGQMTQIDYDAVRNNLNDIVDYNVGSILWGGNTEVFDITANGWAGTYDSLQSLSEMQKSKIPIIFGIDAVHGHNNVKGAVIFPHNVGLGATDDAELIEKSAKIIAKEIKGTGIHWTFAPCVAVARNEKWGRAYESFGEDPTLVKKLSVAFVKGLQGEKLSDNNSVLACIKHFVGDGGTTNGKDQGNTECDEETLRKIHLPGYVEAINNGAKSVMISYNSWNNNKLHNHKYLITDLLKGELKFNGFAVSDWAAIDQLEGDYKSDIEQSINAGLDLIMIPNGRDKENNYIEFITKLVELVKEKKVSTKRIDDAVGRILTVKFELGLFENRYTDKNLTKQVGSLEHRNVARESVRKSMVLLKNENNTLPISKSVKKIHVAGIGADNVGMQCGGWTYDWQGASGREIVGGTSILTAVKKTVSANTIVTTSVDGSGAEGSDIAILVVGEKPYAEMFGDKQNLVLSSEDSLLIANFKTKNIPFVVVLISGRPLIVNSEIEKSNAFIAAWLPGSEGDGIADILFGDYAPTGKLSQTWPKNMEQIPINVGDKIYEPLFPFGFGLSY